MPNTAIIAVAVATVLAVSSSGAVAKGMACDDALKSSFKPDAQTKVLLVKPFKQGEEIKLEKSPAPFPAAPADVCLVKLIVGPGHPGTQDAPSTSAGIGIEVWLPAPANWNGIIRARGSGGWAGGFHSDITAIGLTGAIDPIYIGDIGKGYVVSSSDHGHYSPLSNRDASFALNEDGGIDTVLWKDFAERSMHELAVKTKALVKAYYGTAQKYAYWDGFSTGGRQGLKLAQRFPEDFDGILAGAPAINWTKFITAELYPQIVMQRDLGGPIDIKKLNLVSAAATAACGGTSLGFVLDPTQCRYDPAKDLNVLCTTEKFGEGSGHAAAPACVTLAEAKAIDKIWYGETSDGSYVDPSADNSMSTSVDGRRHLWYGLTRGSSLQALAGTPPFPIASAEVALELQNPAYAQSGKFLVNKTGTGADKWKELDYAELADAAAQGEALQSAMSDINTDKTDLSEFRRLGRKLIVYHGWADDLIMPQGTLNYFARASAAMGGNVELQKFTRLFMIPGLAHDSRFLRAGSIDSETSAPTDPAKVPLPQNATGRDELFMALRAWVEHGTAPSRIDVASRTTASRCRCALFPRNRPMQAPATSSRRRATPASERVARSPQAAISSSRRPVVSGPKIAMIRNTRIIAEAMNTNTPVTP